MIESERLFDDRRIERLLNSQVSERRSRGSSDPNSLAHPASVHPHPPKSSSSLARKSLHTDRTVFINPFFSLPSHSYVSISPSLPPRALSLAVGAVANRTHAPLVLLLHQRPPSSSCLLLRTISPHTLPSNRRPVTGSRAFFGRPAYAFEPPSFFLSLSLRISSCS